MKPASHEKLLRTLARKRAHGIRKKFNGRVPSSRYDSKTPSLVEIHQRPMKLWLEETLKNDEFLFLVKLSSDPERRSVSNLVNESFSFVARDKTFVVTIVRLFRTRLHSGEPCRVAAVVKDAQTGRRVVDAGELSTPNAHID